MTQVNTAERMFKSNRCLLIAAAPAVYVNGEDEIQRIFCDWAAKGILDKEVRDAIASCPIPHITLFERNKYGESRTITASVEFIQQTLRALDVGDLVPTLIDNEKPALPQRLSEDELLDKAGELLKPAMDRSRWIVRLANLSILDRIRLKRHLIQFGKDTTDAKIINRVAELVYDIKVLNNKPEHGVGECPANSAKYYKR